eukprot:12576195-Alexandrium_andersonii.AAC.1
MKIQGAPLGDVPFPFARRCSTSFMSMRSAFCRHGALPPPRAIRRKTWVGRATRLGELGLGV